MTKILIYTDGGARNNPGPAGVGVVIQDGAKSIELKKYIGEQTNNFAEYEAVILAFETLKKLVPENKRDKTEVVVKMDSELVVKQMRGEYKVKNLTLKEQHARLKKIIAPFGTVSFIHVPREQNSDADALANAAMDRSVV